jgi:hypothetical protein
MPRISLWNKTKTHDYDFIDRIVGENVFAGGTGVICHKYMGVVETPYEGDPSNPSSAVDPTEVFIQDLLFLENRDRKYSKDLYEMRGAYALADNDSFDLTQFGAFLANDTMFMNFHIESMVSTLGRKLMPGDVLELPHLRDDLLLGKDDAVNRFMVVKEGTRPAEGYDPRWWPHLWRVKLGTITDSQEYRDILGDGTEAEDLRNLISTYQTELRAQDRVMEQAEVDVPHMPHTRERRHLFVDPNLPTPPDIALEGDGGDDILFGGTIVGSGDQFPQSGVADGDYYLRTDFIPDRLFQKSGSRWVRMEDQTREKWTSANRVLKNFINNDGVTTNSDDTNQAEKTNMSQVVMPRNDTKPRNRPLGYNPEPKDKP